MTSTAASMKATFFTSPAKGTGLRGIELDRCYTGGFDAQGRRHGHGVYQYPNHLTFEGNYVAGLKEGPGKLHFPDGGSYEGLFYDNEIHGHGVRRFANGNAYTGDFEMGEMHGLGVMVFASGDVYQGHISRNVLQGLGKMSFHNGDMYEGEFHSNKINGQGKQAYVCGDSYVGSWKDGKRSGKGRCTFHYGDCYEGYWELDLPHGVGRLDVQLGNLLYEGAFAHGRPTQVPTKMNVSFPIGMAVNASKKGSSGGKGAATADSVDTPIMGVTIGAPLNFAITMSAQFQQPLPEASEVQDPRPVTPVVPGKPKAVVSKAPDPASPAVSEPPSEGFTWQTAAMECKRVVVLTLHPGPPSPLPEGVLIGVCIVNVMLQATGEMRLRVLLLPSRLGKPLPMSRTDDGEAVNGIETLLEQGQAHVDGLVIGAGEASAMSASSSSTTALSPAVNEGLGTPSGTGCLVASAWTLKPGYVRVQLPELKEGKGEGKGKGK